jgi:hypothetical protein
MIPLFFSILSGSACTFLVYVLAQFNREFRHATRSSAGVSQASLPRIHALSQLWYQVHLYHWLESNDYVRFLSDNDIYKDERRS